MSASNSSPRREARERERRRKRARKALLGLLKDLRKKCKTFTTAEKWYAYIERVARPLIAEYAAEIPAADRANIEQAMRLADSTRAGISAACRALAGSLAKVLGGLAPAGGPVWLSAPALIIGGAAVAGVVAGVAVFRSPIEIHVANHGCDPIEFSSVALPAFLGVDLPAEIPTDGKGTVTVSPLMSLFSVRFARADGEFAISMAGLPLRLPFGERLTDVRFDGQTVFHDARSVRLFPGREYLLEIECAG